MIIIIIIIVIIIAMVAITNVHTYLKVLNEISLLLAMLTGKLTPTFTKALENN